MPKAPPSRCTYPGCGSFATNRGRCDTHPNSGWVDRPRKHDRGRTTYDRLGISQHEWQRLHDMVMQRDGGRCHVCGKRGADQVDHIIAVALGGAKTDPANLAPIHSEPCHRAKTARELARLRNRK